jgi:hypothetical protein
LLFVQDVPLFLHHNESTFVSEIVCHALSELARNLEQNGLRAFPVIEVDRQGLARPPIRTSSVPCTCHFGSPIHGEAQT